ncbi:ENHANCER OF AG-4 protein 2 [Platanthera guangdongensis]|uniref:ENHANCER OF AG-4 protein 2 n=1 Tax=Platanthera guangdongensis TaxID=2320717 RepID=A0ABR2LRN7_9ASPA
MSMKHLIAAAQAKRREAHSRQLVDENGTPGSFLTPHCIYGRSPNLISTIQTFPSDDDPFQKDKKCCQTSVPIEPSPVSRQIILMKQGEHGDYDGRPSGGKRQPANSSCDGTEAAIARDALEGMIETLSRTKESIGRATRHSIDCAKYGIATEVVDLLIRKLEGEPNFSRRIDLFFLVDSITQCSHNQKGIAGASYVPVVQAALPRLLCAAAPPGASAHENRRQCLKVLRLWLERRILPEYFLRHYMDEIEFRNGGLRSGCSLRMPACSELSVDNPKRETESLLVDEYGSNTTFLFPGFFSGHVLDDTEDFPGSVCNATADCSPNEADSVSEVLIGSEDHRLQTHRHLLEHLENEIEMEDALTISPDEQFIGGNPSFNLAPYQEHCWAVETKCDNQNEFSLPKGSPPLPLDPPPTLPPLPLSPPPPSPPLPSSPPPLPPPLSLPRISPPSPLRLQSELSATRSVTQSPFLSLPYLYGSRHSLPQEYSSMAANDKQLLQPIGNSDIEGPSTVGLIEETVMSPDFVMPEVRSTNSMLSTISSRPGVYFGHEACHSEQLSQQYDETVQQASFQSSLPVPKILNRPLTSSQIPSNHLCHWKSMHQNHLPQKYNYLPLSSFPRGQTKYSAMEERRSHPCVTNRYYYGAWNGGNVTLSCSPASSAKDGYSRLNVEGASVSVNFHHPTHYLALSRASLPDHNSSNLPAIDSWRPA